MAPRLIRLRRPVTLSRSDGPFVPDGRGGLLDEVERRWDALRRDNPTYYDGRILHVFGVHRNGYGGAVMHVVDCAYRFHAVQREDFDLGVRPLGVKGIAVHNSTVLIGKRSPHVAANAGLWEFAPSGVVEPDDAPGETLRRELHEETGLIPAAEPIALAVLYDATARTWEIVFRVDVRDAECLPRTAEYEALRWCEFDALPLASMSPVAQRMKEQVGLELRPTCD